MSEENQQASELDEAEIEMSEDAVHETPSGQSVTAVLPTTGDRARLERSLRALLREFDARDHGTDDRILVVDDSGQDVADAIVAEVLGGDDDHTATVRVLTTAENLGFAGAVARGAAEATTDLLFVQHDDVVLEEGALRLLTDALEDSSVFAAMPRVERGGAPESAAYLALADDRFVLREGESESASDRHRGAREMTFLSSSAFVARRATFGELGGFDRLFSPFAFEDVDLSVGARRRGLTIVEVKDARAIHGPSDDVDVEDASLGKSVMDTIPAPLSHAIVERNRLLLRWKHLQSRTEARDHLIALSRRVTEAGLSGDRESLEHVCLALAKLPDVTRSRQSI